MVYISSTSLLSLVILIFATFEIGDGLHCYECNSYTNSECAKEIPPPELKKDCNDHPGPTNYTMCRKIAQSIEFEVNGLTPDHRIIRSCAWDDSNYKDKCYQRSGFGGRQEVCSCSTNLCNGSNKISSLMTVPVLIIALLSKYISL